MSAMKQYREHNRRLLFIDSERKKFFKELAKVVSLSEKDKVKTLLKLLKQFGNIQELVGYRENDGETMLHIAAKFNQECEIIKELLQCCPTLLISARKESEDYYGQTALHIAIAKGNVETVEIMLSETLALSQHTKMGLLHQLATGTKFPNTIMMGELPLSVAALTFNQDMLDILLKNGAEMARQNTKGDTVFHTLINFAAIYPECTNEVLETLAFLHNHIQEQMSAKHHHLYSLEFDQNDMTYIWFIQNNEDLNPLQLAAVRSQPAIFKFISELQPVYCFLNNHDGLFDKKNFDITEIDTVAMEKWGGTQKTRQHKMSRHIAPTVAEGVSKQKLKNKTTSCSPWELGAGDKNQSILEIMFDLKYETAFEFIQQTTIRRVIKTKWDYYRWYYYTWMVFHILFMILLTIYSKFKADEYGVQEQAGTASAASTTTATVATSRNETRHRFLEVFSFFYLIVGILYLIHQMIHFLFRVKSYNPLQILNVLDNGLYRLILVIFSVNLIIQFTLSWTDTAFEDYTLIVALITGWWFSIFFLRGWKKFSFFTVMIQKIIFGDILRFSIIIVLMLVAFSAGMYMTFKGSVSVSGDLHSYEGTMMLLFKLMLGLGDIDDLYNARRPWMAVTLFIAFVVLTYVLMFNTLIAMMSQTCSQVSKNRLVQWRVQQLAIIIFFEGIFPIFLKKLVGEEKHIKRYDPKLKQIVEEQRYFLDFSSIQTEYANAEDIYAMRHKLQTRPFGEQHRSTNYTSFTPYYNASGTMRPTQAFHESPTYTRQFTVNRAPVIREEREPEQMNTPASSSDIYSPKANDNVDYAGQRSPKPKRDKSPPKSPNVREPTSEGQVIKESRNIDKSPGRSETRKSKRKTRRQRDEPDGDNNTSYDDQSPDRLYLNKDHLTIPVLPAQGSPQGNRRRYHSENMNLTDTHIGGPTNLDAVPPVHHIQIPVQHVNRMAPTPGYGNVDVGVISDSYM